MADRLIKVTSVQEEVYSRLREMIRNRSLESGKLHLRQLAEYFGVSTMPVREALRRLEAEGAVAFTPNKQVVILDPSEEEIAEIFDIRARLEPFAAERAVIRLSWGEIEALEKLVLEMDDLSDFRRWKQCNGEFHRRINTASGAKRLLTMIENLWLAVEPYRVLYESDLDFLHQAQAQHQQILAALKEHSVEKIGSLISEHLICTRDRILVGFRQTKPAGG